MPDILHKVAIKASPAETYKALTTMDGLSGWWTTDTQGAGTVGSLIHFRFADRGSIDMKIAELETDKHVLWEVASGPDAWSGSKLSFDLAQDDDFTILLFKHKDWKEASEFMHHCSTKWAMFLMSLKAFMETGRGAPFPNDVHISNKGD
ncbi:SRPBCC family protein [Sphingomonas sp.]|uniref:SRPBCC family protein n=1 Tax=Sphingomonas sp. TaxID=28214 RepID=UPI003D6D0E2A